MGKRKAVLMSHEDRQALIRLPFPIIHIGSQKSHSGSAIGDREPRLRRQSDYDTPERD